MKKLFLLLIVLTGALTAGAQCVASFTASNTANGNNLLQWTFNNTSGYGSGTGLSYTYTSTLFNFGDGMSNSYGGVHNYSAPGTYTVGLRIKRYDSVTNTLVCSDTTHQTITVAYSPCATIFSDSVSALTCTFYTSTPGATGPVTYTWNFGDGTAGTGANPVHTYTANGWYNVMVVATCNGCSYSNSMYVHINYVQLICGSAHADFQDYVSGNYLYLYDYSSYGTGYTETHIVNYGDGSANTNAMNHTYALPGTYLVKYRTNWYDSVTQNLFCTDSTSRSITIDDAISGHIYYDSLNHPGQQYFKVWLIQFDSVTNLLSAIDSITTNGISWVTYSFTGKPAGNYLVKAAMLNQTVGTSGVVPTYSTSSPYWSGATNISHSGFGIYNFGNIWMQNGTVTSGPGFVGGNVSLGANKGASNGVPGLQIYLRDNTGAVIKNAVTDANGDFSFSNIPTGTYSVYPENMNYATTPASNITVTNGTPTANSINFHQDNSLRNIKPHGLSINNIAANEAFFMLSPNPAHGGVRVAWNANANTEGAQIILSNITGQAVRSVSVGHSNNNNLTINISDLQPGVYFLRGTAALQGQTQKLIVE